MKIILINYHYFIHGGPDRYFFNIKKLLESEGHEVIPFSFNYQETIDTPFRQYFPAPISGKGTFLIENMRLTPFQKLTYICKMFWNREVERKFVKLLENECPDLVYSIYLSSSLLPKILHVARKRFGIPVVYRLSDFHMFCPSYLFFRNGEICRDCLTQPYSAIKYKCVQGSTLASLVRVLQNAMIRARRWYDSVDCFVCPSRLMAANLLEGGIPRKKVEWVPTFTDDLQGSNPGDEATILYFGKLVREKGVEILVRAYNAWDDPKYPLLLVGHCSAAYRNYLLSLLDPFHRNKVTISKPLQGEDMWRMLRSSAFVVQPAIWLENMPNTLVEALSAGKPVVASEVGSLTELISQGENGYLVPPGDVQALSEALEKMSTEADLEAMGRSARRRYEENHTAALHLRRLHEIFSQLTNRCQVS